MSLINDALKQTQRIQPQNPPLVPSPLLPAESNSPEGLGWLVPGIIVLLLAAVGVFVGLSLSKPARLAANSLPVVAPAPRPVQTAAVAPALVTNVASNASPVAVVPPKPPAPKLQGILFAATRPCAIVNGRTVFVGDRINEFRVAAISKDDVTLQSETETKVLSLNPQ